MVLGDRQRLAKLRLHSCGCHHSRSHKRYTYPELGLPHSTEFINFCLYDDRKVFDFGSGLQKYQPGQVDTIPTIATSYRRVGKL